MPKRRHILNTRKNGNTLILILAITVGLVASLLLFALSFVRLVGASREQKTAIEAAALAAARDLSKIVVNSNEWGFVSLSDGAPITPHTVANDHFPLPVYGINTLIGTARLDLIIADKFDDDEMRALARKDLASTLGVWTTQLLPVLQASIQPNGVAQDVDGNTVRPYQSALNAYQQNQIRLTGSTSYVSNSMRLQLGCVTGGTATNIPIPVPQTGPYGGPVAADLQAPGNTGSVYLSYVNIPYAGTDFVFGGIGDTVRLVDAKRWVTSIKGLPYQIPTIVRVDADQLIKDLHSPNGQNVHASACAQPASVYDPKPHPGALSISFPDGAPPGVNSPGALFTDAQLNDPGNQSEILTSSGGDYPTDNGSSLVVSNHPLDSPGTTNTRPIGRVWRVAFFDWVRRAGVKAQIDQVMAVNQTAFNPANPAKVWWSPYTSISGPNGVATAKKSVAQVDGGVIHIFRFLNDGGITYQSKPLAPYPYSVLSENQFYAESLDAYSAGSDVSVPIASLVALSNGGANGNGGQNSDENNNVNNLSSNNNQGDNGKNRFQGNQVVTMSDPLIFKHKWDVFIRDENRVPGKFLGGKHGGEPLNNEVVAHHNWIPIQISCDSIGSYASYGNGTGAKKVPKKLGSVPLLGPQSDFAESMMAIDPPSKYTEFQKGTGTGVRPTYTTTGTSVDIRFRRQIDVSNMATKLGFSLGYLTEEVSMKKYP